MMMLGLSVAEVGLMARALLSQQVSRTVIEDEVDIDDDVEAPA